MLEANLLKKAKAPILQDSFAKIAGIVLEKRSPFWKVELKIPFLFYLQVMASDASKNNENMRHFPTDHRKKE